MNHNIQIKSELLVLILTASVHVKRLDVFKLDLLASERELRRGLSLASPEAIHRLNVSFPEVFKWLDERQNIKKPREWVRAASTRAHQSNKPKLRGWSSLSYSSHVTLFVKEWERDEHQAKDQSWNICFDTNDCGTTESNRFVRTKSSWLWKGGASIVEFSLARCPEETQRGFSRSFWVVGWAAKRIKTQVHHF
jgi:hypothetical protein